MKRMKKVAAATLTAIMVASISMGTTESWARSSKRAAWNNAAAESSDTEMEVKDACYVEDGSETDVHNVKSNVYANSTEWNEWKTKWESVRKQFCQIALTPGTNETQLNAAWYSTTENDTPKIKLMDASGKEVKTFDGTISKDTDVEKVIDTKDNSKEYTLYPCKVTLTGLTENTSYKYQYFVNGSWSDTYDYKTKNTESFSVMYVGDPQIGASTNQLGNQDKEYYAMNDSYNWYHTLNNAIKKFPELSFVLSAGDQINQTSVSKDSDKLEQQIEYAGFLNSSVLRSLPIATTIGNHDSKSVNYSNHFNYPNKQTANVEGKTVAGTDYYFTYGNTLFISIDTNNYNVATHESVIKEATEKNKDVTWRVLMFHQDIYGSGYDHSDSDGIVLRTQLTPVIDKYDIDAVLQGHDHTYSRTYQLSSDNKEHGKYSSAASTSDKEAFSKYISDNMCYNLKTGAKESNRVVDPEGTVYFEANSATGSKFYQLIGTQQDYIAARCQSWRPTYSVIDITETTLTVNTYDAATNEKLVADGNVDTTYTIVKQADKSALESEIAKSENALEEAKNGGNTTEASMKSLEDAIVSAKEVYNTAESTKEDIASAVVALQEARASLETISSAVKDETAEIKDETGTVAAATIEKGAVIKDADGNMVDAAQVVLNAKKLNDSMVNKMSAALKNNSTVKSLDNVDYYDLSLATKDGSACTLENGKVKVTFKVKDGIDTSKYDIRVFHYNESAEKLEELSASISDAGITVEAESFSPYAVYYEQKENVQTGDNILPVALWLILAGLAGAGAVAIVITERKREAE